MPRSRRFCSCCSHDDREDELHLLTCGCYHGIRTKSTFLFTEFPSRDSHQMPLSFEVDNISDSCINKFFNPPSSWLSTPDNYKLYKKFWHEFAFYLVRCKVLRASLVEFQNVLVSPMEVDLPDDLD